MMRCRGVLEIPYVQSHMFDEILGLMMVDGFKRNSYESENREEVIIRSYPCFFLTTRMLP